MRVSLLHNRDAGSGVPFRRIRTLIERMGHEVVSVADTDASVGQLVDDRTDVVVVAGGDGTVATAARLMAGRDVPLAILPIGTANNISASVNGGRTAEQLISGWATASRLPFDLGIVRGPDGMGEHRFLEAVGMGLVPAAIESAQRLPLRQHDRPSRIARAIRRYRQVLSRLDPVQLTLSLDGERLSGAFLLVEVLNIRSVGPQLVLSADADPSDGFFSVVTAGASHRDALDAYLQDRIEGRAGSLSLPSRRAQKVEIRGGGVLHIDDELRSAPVAGAVSIVMEPSAVTFLA